MGCGSLVEGLRVFCSPFANHCRFVPCPLSHVPFKVVRWKRKAYNRVVRYGLRVFRSQFATRYSLLAIRYSLPFPDLPICRFHDLPISSARQEPRPPITLTHYALRITLTSFPFLSWHNCDEHENGAKCDVRCWVRCAECGVKLMGFCSSNLRAKERA